MSELLHFLPWLRRGLGLTLTERDDGRPAVTRAPAIDPWVSINGEEASATISLRPADHVTGIDSSMIIRRYPAPLAAEAEFGYFPLVELSAPDLPWLVSPLAPDETTGGGVLRDSTGRLRPWVSLVCVEDASAQLVAANDGGPSRLHVAADQLPPPGETYGWAHVQSTVQRSETVAASEERPGAVVARLVCPRRLLPGTVYRAALVAAYAPDPNVDDQLVAAWAETGQADLAVYDSWTFTTGQASSFETLVQRLGPIEDLDLQLGLVTMEVSDGGPLGPWPVDVKNTTADYAGALWDTSASPEALGQKAAAHFETVVTDLLSQGDARLVLTVDAPDPVVTPPFFGSYASGVHQVPADYWQRDLNIDPKHRATAGLGAEVVRRNQERFMALAWQQAGQLRETNRQLSFARLQSEIGRTAKARIDRLDPHQRTALYRPQISFLRDGAGRPPRRLLERSSIPNAILSPAYLRSMRPGGVAVRAGAGRAVESPSIQAAIGDSYGSPAVREELHLGVPGPPAGTGFANPVRDAYTHRTASLDAAATAEVGPPATADDPPSTTRDGQTITLGNPETLQLDRVADLATAEVRPIMAVRARMEARIQGLSTALSDPRVGADELPSRVKVGPKIDEALMWPLVELSAELLMPGAQQFPDNAVRVVEVNRAFIASYMAGANREMTGELLWREFPAELGSTTFCRFWDRPDRTATDIVPIETWLDKNELVTVGGGETDSLVVLVRGDLIRHYPTVQIYLRHGEGGEIVWPAFGGALPPDIRFLGFEVDSADVITAPGSGWQVVFEEQLTEPRFGLDDSEAETPPNLQDWNDLSWDHLDGQGGPGSHLLIAGGLRSEFTEPDGATWGLNSAHMARATYQAPVRWAMDVDRLIGDAP